MKDLAPLATLFRIQAILVPTGYILTQQIYAHNILRLAGLSECHPIVTTAATKHQPSSEENTPHDNPTQF